MSFEQKLLKIFRTLLLVGVIFGAIALWFVQWWLEHPRTQPIAFYHAVHVGQRQISCYFCHTGVEHGSSAGVPSVQDCMQCHQVVSPDNPEIKKVAGYWERKESIRWYKVYQVPKHVHFNHKVHIAFGLQCEQCHGNIGSMQAVYRAHKLSMGFCINCHATYAGKQLTPDGPVAPSKRVLLDCSTCHY